MNEKRTKEYYMEKYSLDIEVENGFLEAFYPVAPSEDPSVETYNYDLFSWAFYLLPTSSFNPFHKLNIYETWHYSDGCSLKLYTISPKGKLSAHILGPTGPFCHVVIPGYWMCAVPIPSEDYDFTLITHVNVPSFDPRFHFKGWKNSYQLHEKGTKGKLQALFPEHKELIEKYHWREDL